MRRKLSLLVSAAACAGLFALLGSPTASAELGCPDQMTPAPEAFVRQGDKKDKNGNDMVCVKPTTCIEPGGPVCHGGPDDEFGLPLLGADGNWYYVVDDVS